MKKSTDCILCSILRKNFDSRSFFDANLDLATPGLIQKASSYADSVQSADGVDYENCAQQIFTGLNLGQTETLDTGTTIFAIDMFCKSTLGLSEQTKDQIVNCLSVVLD